MPPRPATRPRRTEPDPTPPAGCETLGGMSDLVQQVEELAAAATEVDGVAPFSEQPLLDLRSHAGSSEVPASLRPVVVDGELVAAALHPDDDPDSVEVVVHPDHRRRGLGGELVRAVLADRPAARFWAHGNLPAARATARAAGLELVRELLRMERELGPTSVGGVLPEGFSARAFEPGRDEEAWLEVNAAAFAHHPEQGRMTRTDLDRRMAEPWFDPAGLILVHDDTTGALAGSHWTKVPTDQTEGEPRRGEVYVVAVAPAYQGRGLARPVTELGLAHLASVGVDVVELYVEGDNTPALRTYERQGFTRAATDAMYARAVHGAVPK